MSGVVTFNEAGFLQRYPQFTAYATVNPGSLQTRFDEVTMLYINNSLTSVVKDPIERSMLINMAIAHTLQLDGVLSPGGAGSTGGQVGRVSDASEGTVSASLDMGVTNPNAAWWMQTQYGASYWSGTAKYRTVRYARAPRRCGWP